MTSFAARRGQGVRARLWLRLLQLAGPQFRGERGHRVICALALIGLIACDDGFSPLASGEQEYSVFGFLNASVDTQWIRIAAIRPLVLTSPDPLVATVTLEHLATGRAVALHDSVFSYDPGETSDGMFLHNFWTAEPIEAGAAYRFAIARDGQERAEAVVSIPRDFGVEVWFGRNIHMLRLLGLGHVAFVRKITEYQNCPASTIPHQSVQADGEDQVILISPGPAACIVVKRELWAVGSGAEWPAGAGTESWRLGVPDAASNISNSVGFLGGVLSKTIPYENCQLVEWPASAEYCRLHYGETSALLRGRIRDATCGGTVSRATVQLLEIGAGATHKLRSTVSGPAGDYEVGALEQGARYALSFRRIALGQEHPDSIPRYEEHSDTVMFAAGEQRRYDLSLRRLSPCRP